MFDILYTCCRDTSVKILTVNLPADENFLSLVQYFIYLLSRPPGDTYGVQFLLVKLAIDRRAIETL
jgi:hypothetical protein